MRLSLVFELLLIFILLAFAASRVINSPTIAKKKVQRQGPPNRYCACTNLMCNCCRDFSLPVVPIKGPGCATLSYLQGDSMMITMSFGNRVLHNTTITGKRPKPVCMPLPGGISKFCGRVYGISRQGENFKACLGLELRALDDVEAALRVSCFRFGPQGLNLEPAPPVPPSVVSVPEDDDDDDDDDYSLDDDDDDDDDDEDGFDIVDDDDDDDDDDASENDVSPDYGAFSVFGDEIFGGFFSEGSKKKKKTSVNNKPNTVVRPVPGSSQKPLLASTAQPVKGVTKPTVKPLTKPALKPVRVRTTAKPVRTTVRTTRKPPTRFTTRRPSTTTSTTTASPVTKAPQIPNETENLAETVTSTAFTVTVMQADEVETVLPEGMEKADETTVEENQTLEGAVETTTMEASTYDDASVTESVEDDSKKEDAYETYESVDEDNINEDDDDNDNDEEEDEDDDGDEEEDEDEDVEENGTETTAESNFITDKNYEKKNDKGDDDDDDDDGLDLDLDDDDDDDDDDEEEEENNKSKRMHRSSIAFHSGRTHRRMRL